MRWELLRRRSEGSGSVNSQESPAWWPTASDTGRNSGRCTPENPTRSQCQITSDHNLKTDVNRLQRSVARRLNEWRNDQWSAILESRDPEDQSLWKMTRWVMRIPIPPLSPRHHRGNRCLRLWENRSPCRKSGSSVSAGERSFGPSSYEDCWRDAVVLIVKPCQRTPINYPWRGSRRHLGSQGQQGSGSERYTENGIEESYQMSVFRPRRIFNAVVRTHHFLQKLKHARVISILKLGKDPALPSSYRPISALDTIGKLFENIPLGRILDVVNERGLLREEWFGIRRRYSTFLQLPRLVEKILAILAKKGSPAKFPSMWPKPSIPSGSMASSTG
jgi:hypothetical protein